MRTELLFQTVDSDYDEIRLSHRNMHDDKCDIDIGENRVDYHS